MLNKLLGLVENVSEHGYQMDQMLEFVHWVMAILFIGWSCFFFTALFRFHKSRSPKADYHGVRSKASTHIELMVVLAESVFLLGFGIPLWGKMVYGPKPESEVDRVRVVAEQYKWNFHYPGDDGVFGRQKIDFISPANPLGIDPADKNSFDDIVVSNEMHLQIDRNVITEISSKDVIHSFASPFLRIGQDAIPGMVSPIWFKPIKTGSYEIVCGQLCGTGHYAMKGTIVVDTAEDFEAWKKEMLSMKVQPTSAPAPETAPAAAPEAAAPAVPEAVAPEAAAPAASEAATPEGTPAPSASTSEEATQPTVGAPAQ